MPLNEQRCVNVAAAPNTGIDASVFRNCPEIMRARRDALMLLANRERCGISIFQRDRGTQCRRVFLSHCCVWFAAVWQAVHEGNVSEDGALWRGRHYVAIGFN